MYYVKESYLLCLIQLVKRHFIASSVAHTCAGVISTVPAINVCYRPLPSSKHEIVNTVFFAVSRSCLKMNYILLELLYVWVI